MPDESIETVTVSEAMELLGKSDKSIRNYIERGRLSAETGPDRKLHIPKSEVLQLARHPAQIQADQLEKVTKEVEDLKARLATAEQLLETLTSRLEALTSQPTTTTYAPTTPVAVPPRSRPASSGSSGGRAKSTREELPEHLVTWRPFADLHGIPPSNVALDISKGKFATREGQWKKGKATVDRALDERDRQAFYERYHHRPTFKTCPNCPHVVAVEE